MTAVAPVHPQPGFYETVWIVDTDQGSDGGGLVIDYRYVEQVRSRPRYEAPKWDIEASWAKICEAVEQGEKAVEQGEVPKKKTARKRTRKPQGQ